jgi:NitT/TauT family transport system ATP-binding protein
MKEPLLVLAGVEAGYGTKAVVSSVDLALEDGELVVICGGSGGGKSTLLRVAAGLLRAWKGTVIFRGAPVTDPPRGLQVVFQQYADSLFPWLTVAGNVRLALLGEGVTGDRAEARIREVLETVQLQAHAEALPGTLSGGMAQRAAIARALAVRPALLCMDEPFGALDAATRRALQDELLALADRPAILFVTHDIDEALYLGDRVIVVSGGRLHELRPGLPKPRDQVATPALPAFQEARRTVFGMLRG